MQALDIDELLRGLETHCSIMSFITWIIIKLRI